MVRPTAVPTAMSTRIPQTAQKPTAAHPPSLRATDAASTPRDAGFNWGKEKAHMEA